MQRRFEADPQFQATVLLLQERVPKTAAVYLHAAELRPSRDGSVQPAEARLRVFADPDTRAPGGAAAVERPLPRDAHQRRRRLQPLEATWRVTRWREDATRDHWGTFCYLRDVDSGEFWSTAYQPTLRSRPSSYEAIFSEARAEFRAPRPRASTRTPRSSSRRRTTSSCGAPRITNRGRSRAHDRGDELRRGGAGAAGRRRAASGLQQAVRADRARARAAGDPVHAPAARRRRARRRGCST